jgi:hypothetical protein
MNNNNKQNMKNTMKIKSLLSFFVPAALMTLVVASCSDYDNGYNESAIKFQEEFRKAFGDIDPEQDWNLAERATVTVSTMKESEVKIYALRGDEYVLVGDYEGVNGTRVLGFDMVEGTTNIMVTDGETAEQAVPGGVVTFGGTRTVGSGNGTVGIETITNENGDEINNVNYPKYKEATSADYDAMKAVIPEIGWRNNYTNLNKVTHDFTYVSNGTFIVYPYYWETSSNNTIGIYYYENGIRQEVDIYTIKAGNEFQYATSQQYSEKVGNASGNVSGGKNTTNSRATLWWNFSNWYTALTWNETWGNVAGGDASNLFGFSADDIRNATKLVLEGIDFQQDTKAFRVIFFGENGQRKEYPVYSDDVHDGKYEFLLSNLSTEIRNNCTICLAGGYGAYQDGGDNPQYKFKEYDGQGDNYVYGEVRFSSIKLVTDDGLGWQDYNQNFCSEIFSKNLGTKVRGQGIKVTLNPGTVFGMYLKKADASGNYTFYSQSELNEAGIVGNGVIDNGAGSVTNVSGMHPCYASTFYVGNQMFLGFEDWPNVYDESDFDLNDVVFAFDGCKPTVINEDSTPGGTWMLVCEDLGGSFDTDYNDVIFKVEHISGQKTANVTALAAGGTLASYIFFRDPTTLNADDQVVGEIHQMFNEAPAVSGAYTPINVGYPSGTDRFEKNGNTVTINVGENWTMAYYQADQFHEGNKGAFGDENTNMGGFTIRTLMATTEAPTGIVTANHSVFGSSTSSVIAAPNKGDAPYILCLPYSYIVNEGRWRNEYVWAWPLELCTICSSVYDQTSKYRDDNGGAYNKFGVWVQNYQNNKDWYKLRTNYNTVDLLQLSAEYIQQNTGEKQPNPISSVAASLIYGRGVNFKDFVIFPEGYENNVTYQVNDGTANYSDYFHPDAPGTYTITVTQQANDKYESGTTKFTLMVHQAYTLTVDGKILGYDSGALKLVNYTNNNTRWVLEPTGDGTGSFYMYNVGAKKYLTIHNGYTQNVGSFYAEWADSPKGIQMARFWEVDGKIQRYGGDRYLGANPIADWSVVDANAGASGGSTAITWTKTAVSVD